MLALCDLIGFIPTRDGESARRFYVETLKLDFDGDDGFAVVVKAKGKAIRIVRVGDFKPAAYTILGWEVTDIAEAVRELSAAGVEFTRYPYFEQDPLGIWTSPSGSKVAWFQDPDGNVLSISQH